MRFVEGEVSQISEPSRRYEEEARSKRLFLKPPREFSNYTAFMNLIRKMRVLENSIIQIKDSRGKARQFIVASEDLVNALELEGLGDLSQALELMKSFLNKLCIAVSGELKVRIVQAPVKCVF